MTEAQQKAINELREAGYAVILWTPEELDGTDPRDVEDRSVETGHEVIAALGGRKGTDDALDYCEECGNSIPGLGGGSIANRHHKASCSLYDPKAD